MTKQFLNRTGLKTFLLQLESLFATKEEVTQLKTDTDPYIFEIDYDAELEFDTTFIVTGDSSSPMIDVGQVGFMIIAKS